MNKKRIGYWIATVLFCLTMAAGGVMNLVHAEQQKQVMASLGYPEYLMTILGVAKLLGVVALLLPRTALLKEWAYAGFTFDLLGASASHALSGDAISEVIVPLVVLALAAASYFLRPETKKCLRDKA
jgi:uncharacterized membrane protein YphA (DoxX/SURF4 family)